MSLIETESWPWRDLERGAYTMIMADPPWTFKTYSAKGEGKSPQSKYSCMTLDEIKTLPVADLAAEDALLWLWATAPMLDKQLEVLKAWGFRFVTSGVWLKTTRHGKVNFGTGFVLRNSHESFLIGKRGKPKTTRVVRSGLVEAVREHSRKPECAYDAAEKLMPWARRADLFSRQSRPGWTAWGDQTGMFG